MGRVFISYRRDDTQEEAARLFRDLKERLPRHFIFLDDGGDLLPGDQWKERLGDEIVKADVFLALIGRQWTNAQGSRGLKDPRSVVRREMEWFLKNHKDHGCLLPVLVGDLRMPRRYELPASLHPLLESQADRLMPSNWDREVEALADRIQALIAQSEQQLEQILTKWAGGTSSGAGSDGKAFGVTVVNPSAGGDCFEDMPIYGKWRARITSGTPSDGRLGPTGRATLLLALKEDLTFTGTAKMHRKGLGRLLGTRRFHLDGKWNLTLWDRGGLLLKLEAAIDESRDWYMRMPIAERRGRGYFAKDEDGTVYWLESRGGRPVGF